MQHYFSGSDRGITSMEAIVVQHDSYLARRPGTVYPLALTRLIPFYRDEEGLASLQ